ncbi:MAG: Multi-sensor signal transduction histidine kinase [Chthoniobacteraceae bacterium]|nr:Multi-sensor signal transduction histidine kinase [Chthoniobacteraceae bacterium]
MNFSRLTRNLGFRQTMLLTAGGFALIALGVTGVTLVSRNYSHQGTKETETLTEQFLPGLVTLAGLQDAAHDLRSITYQFALAKDETGMAARKKEFQTTTIRFTQCVAQLQLLARDEPTQRFLAGFGLELQSYREAVEKFQKELGIGEFENAMATLDQKVEPAQETIELQLEILSDQYFQLSQKASARTTAVLAQADRFNLLATVVLAGFTLLCLTLLLGATRALLVQMKQRDAERQAAQGVLEKRVEERTAALRDSEEKLRGIFEHSAQVFYSHTVDGQLTYVSPQAEQLLDCSPAEALQPWTVFLANNPINAVGIESTRQAIETGKAQRPYQLELKTKMGRTVWAEIHESPVVVAGKTVAIVGALTDVTARHRAEVKLLAEKTRFARQRDALIALTSSATNGEDLMQSIRRLTETDARTLGVARVSVWRYNSDRTAICCVDLYELETDRHSAGAELPAPAFPAYFRALEELNVISARDANLDSRTCEFSEIYLQPLGITSMLDAPIHLAGIGDGVLCHEHIGSLRQWTTDEETFAVAVASRASLALEGAERQRAEAELRWKTALLEAQLDSSLDGILVVNDQSRQVLKNQRFNEVWDIPRELADATDDRKFVEFAMTKTKNSAEFFERVSYLNAHPEEVSRDEIELIDGGFLERYSAPVKDKRGGQYGRIWAFRDVTERKRAEQELRNAHEQLEQMLAHSPAVLYRLKVEGKSLVPMAVSANITRLLGFSPADAVDQAWWLTQVHPEDRDIALASIEDLMAHGASRSEYRVRHKAGNYRWMEGNRRLLQDAAGQPVEITGVWMDITDRKQSEHALEKAHRELVDLSRRAGMAEIATNVLHNVGNVLNSVNVSADLLRRQVRKTPVADLDRIVALLQEQGPNLGTFFTTDPRGTKVTEFLARAALRFTRAQETQLQEVTSLQKNIEHIKEIVAMQQSYARVSGVTERLQITDLVEDALRMNGGALQRHAVPVGREFALGLPSIATDRHKILQILVNLLSNAKHACDGATGEEKRITVRVTQAGDRLRVEVIDTGVGISAENLDRIFNHGFTTKKEGHGFGLHSAANAAKELGGALTVHSAGLGQGATFTLELPCPTAKKTI